MKLLLVTALIAAAPLGAQSPAPFALAARLAGCYRLDDGPWRADSVHVGDTSTRYTPLYFELARELAPGWDALQSTCRRVFAVNDSSRMLIYWQPYGTAPDTIAIRSSPLAFAGIVLTFTPRVLALLGTVWDAHSQTRDAQQRLEKVETELRARVDAISPAPKQRTP
jgi:hypothetical protein